MRTRRREYGSPPPPPARILRKRGPANSPLPPPAKRRRTKEPAKVRTPPKIYRKPILPLEVLEVVLYHAVEQANEEITNTHELPANGSVRSNRRLSELICLTLCRDINDFLQTLKWKRVSIVYKAHSAIADPGAIPPLERLAEELLPNLHRAVTIDVTLDCLHPVPARVLEVIIGILQSVNRDRIREVSFCFSIPPVGDEMMDLEGENLMMLIDRLMMIIPTFEKLTTFRFLMGNSAYVSESCLALIIQRLPLLHTILLYGHFGISHQRLKEYRMEDLGQALASRPHLKSLNIRNLNSFASAWLDLDWRPELEELTVEVQRSVFDETQLLRFCHIFHETLVSLNFERGPIGHPRSVREAALARIYTQGFQALKYLTYNGHPATLWAFSRAPNLEKLTWSVWLSRRTDFQTFRTHQFPTPQRWPSLRRIQVPDNLQDQPVLKRACEQFGTFLQQHGIELRFIAHDEIIGLDEAFHVMDSRLYPKPIRLPLDI